MNTTIVFSVKDANQQSTPPPISTPARKPPEEKTATRRKGGKRSYAETINDEDSSLYNIVRNGRSTLPVRFIYKVQ